MSRASRLSAAFRNRAWPRSAATLAAAAIAAAAVSACGSSTNDAAVIQVAGNPISKAAMEHWMRVESVLTYRVIPKEPPPKGLLPDPPGYSACIAWLGSSKAPLTDRQTKSTPAQLKSRCEQRLAELKKKALTFLITYQWLIGEAKDLGLIVSDAEVEKAVRRFQRSETPGSGEFQRYLSYAGMSVADAQYIQRLTVAGTKVQNGILAKRAGQARQALAAFNGKWIAKTSCKAGYVVPGCKQYKGSEPPP